MIISLVQTLYYRRLTMNNQCCLEERLLDHLRRNGLEPHDNQLFNLNGEFQTYIPRNDHDIFCTYIGWDGMFANNEAWALFYYWPSLGRKLFAFSSHPELLL